MIGRYLLPSPDEEGSDTLREGGKDNYERLVWVLFSPAPSLQYVADCMTSLPRHLLGHL